MNETRSLTLEEKENSSQNIGMNQSVEQESLDHSIDASNNDLETKSLNFLKDLEELD